MLRATGHFNQQPTGYFGSVTKRSVTAFQNEWGLVSDGLVSQATWDKLEEVSAVHMKHAETQTKSSTSGFNAINLIADASELIGVPYVWGGTTTSGFDCSGFIQYVFKKNGVNLPRTAAQQYNAGSSVSSPQVGDIVFFETYKAGPSHNGIYIGNNQFIHAGSSTGVTIANMNSSYWSQRYLGAKRVR
jgi:cell wall-associated NlpC family hydrolase